MKTRTIEENIKLENSELVIKRPINAALVIEISNETEKGVEASGGYIGTALNGFHALEHAVHAIAEPLIREGINDKELLTPLGMALCKGLQKAVRANGKEPSKFDKTDPLDLIAEKFGKQFFGKGGSLH